MKKILCFAIAALMLVAMVGCNFGSGDGEMSENTSDALTTERAETPTTEKVTDKGDSTTETNAPTEEVTTPEGTTPGGNTPGGSTTEDSTTDNTTTESTNGDTTTENEPTTTEPVTGDQWTNIY